MKTRVSDQWKSFLEKSVLSNTITEAVKMKTPGLEKRSIRLTKTEIYQIEQLAKQQGCTFDDIVNQLLKMVYDCRFQLSKMKSGLLSNLPMKLDGENLAETDWDNKSILFNTELLNKTCLIGRKRSNASGGEMPLHISEILVDGSRIDFRFFVGSTVRLALQNYELFRRMQAIIQVSKEKHER